MRCGTFQGSMSLLVQIPASWCRFSLSLYRFSSIITKSYFGRMREIKDMGAEINAKEEGNIMKYSTIKEEEAKRIEAIPNALDSYLNKSLTVHNNDSV